MNIVCLSRYLIILLINLILQAYLVIKRYVHNKMFVHPNKPSVFQIRNIHTNLEILTQEHSRPFAHNIWLSYMYWMYIKKGKLCKNPCKYCDMHNTPLMTKSTKKTKTKTKRKKERKKKYLDFLALKERVEWQKLPLYVYLALKKIIREKQFL